MGEFITLKFNNDTADIAYMGAELISYKKDGKQVIWQGDERFWLGHAPVLFPICGGLKDDIYCLDGKKYTLAKHGFSRKQPFSLVESSQNSATFVLTESEKSKESFPFNFRLYIKYTLADSLTVEYIVHNTDEKDMYFTIGAHEGYALEDKFENYSIVFEKEEDLHAQVLDGNLLNHEYISLGEGQKELKLDYKYFEIDALVFKDIKSRKVWLKHQEKGKQLQVEFDDFKHLLLWTKPNAPYICIEPWIALPDYVDAECDITKKPDVVKLSSNEQKSFIHVIK